MFTTLSLLPLMTTTKTNSAGVAIIVYSCVECGSTTSASYILLCRGRQVDVAGCSISSEEQPCPHHFYLDGASTASLPSNSGDWKRRYPTSWHLTQSLSLWCRLHSKGVNKAQAMALKSIRLVFGEVRPRPPRPLPHPRPRPNRDPSPCC
jgi:hypothetical protein